jgi:acetyl coenzyme A synthetase (ADP forming)-like protein
MSLDSIFKPQSIAVIGASRDREKVGNIVLRNILSTFHGKVYAVNNKAEQIENLKSYKSITAISEKVDLAVVTVPRQFVPQVMEEAARKGAKSAIVITSGFREVDIYGAKLEDELRKITKKYGMRFLGPNTLGLITPSFNATFTFSDVKRGNIALVAQSGGIGVYMLNWAQMTRTGISHFVSLGNQSDITETEVYEYLVHDPETRAIFTYVEGVADGKRFLDIVPSIAVRKPLVFLKGGVGKSGADAVRTHTGSLAGSMEIFEAAVKAVGGILVDDLEDFLDLIKLVSSDELIKPDFLVITNSGGHGVLATDEIERQSANLIKLPERTREELSKVLPPQSTPSNPLDLSGDANKDRYNKALEIVQHLDCSKLVVVQSLPMITCTEVAKVLLTYKGKNMIGVMMGMDEDAAARILDSAQIPAFTFPEDAVRSIKRFTSRKEPRRKIRIASPIEEAKSLIAGKYYLKDFEAMKMCQIYGLKTPKYGFATTIDEAMKVADEIRYPLVMKISADEPVHKTEIGGVRINIGKEQMATSFSQLSQISRRILIQEQLSGLEVFLGGVEDPSFGHTVLVGPGGIYVEILKDVAYGLSPLSEDEAVEILQENKVHQMLTARGKNYDETSLIRVITTISRMIVDLNVKEIDINPLIVNEKGAFAVDVRTILQKQTSEPQK